MQIDKGSVKNILVIRNDRFGEFLLNIPAFRALKETFSGARLIAVVNPSVKSLAENIPFFDEVIEWDSRKHSLSEKIRLVNLLKNKKIDIAVMLNPVKDFNIITYFSGIPVRVGYNRKYGFLLTHKIEDKKFLSEKHEVEYNLELVSLIGAKTEDKTLSLPVDDSQAGALSAYINLNEQDNFIVIHPWTSDPVKQWPVQYFKDLAERLIRQEGAKIVVVGGKEELDKSIELFTDMDKNLINLTGKTTLMQLAALLKKSRLLISADSGPVHLASAVGGRVLAIFRNDIPGKCARRWGPWGEGHAVIEKSNLSDITVTEVFDKAKKLISS